MKKRKKISMFTQFMFLDFVIICLFTPLLIYLLILIYLLFELGYLMNVYFTYLNDLYDIDFEETFSQRQIVAFHFFMTTGLIMIGIVILHYCDKYMFAPTIMDLTVNDFKVFVYSLMYFFIRFILMFFVISKIHNHILINKIIGIQNAQPPLCRLISKIINKIKYGNENND